MLRSYSSKNTKVLCRATFILAFVAVSFSLSLKSTPVSAASANTLSVATSGNQSVNIVPNSSGTTASIITDNITVNTSCPSGYNFAISTSVNDNNLYLNGNSANNTSGTYFAPASGSSALSSSPNTWGYYYNSSTAPTTASVFSAVPTLSNPTTIISPLATPSSTGISDNFSIYYGAASPASMSIGSYKMIPDTNNNNNNGTIVYYVTMADACTKYTVHFNPTSTSTGSAITGTGTMNDQLIEPGIATNLSANGFTAPSGYRFDGWNTAQDGTGTTYTDGQSVTDLTTVGSTVTLYAQWEQICPSGNICYNANGSNVVGTMGRQSVSTSATSITLLASNFSRAGYGFAGWSDVKDYTTNPNAHFYGPQEGITFTAGQYTSPNYGLDLYAVWVESAGYLQNSTLVATLCGTGTGSLTTAPTDGTANLSSVSALTDQRDNETYAIAKLADGKCWMIENLRLESQYTVGQNQNNPSVTNQSLAQGYATSTAYGNFSGLANAESASFDNVTTANSLYYSGTQSGTASINIGTTDYPARRMPRYNNWNSQRDATNNGVYSYGNYYTWSAAVADTAYYATNNQSITNTSICPAGWRLPKGGDRSNENNNDFWKLIVADINSGTNPANYDSNTTPYYTGTSEGSNASNAVRTFPNNFIYSGYFDRSSASYRNSVGFYWSSTSYARENDAFYSYNAYLLYINDSIVSPGTNNGWRRWFGISIRCMVSTTPPQNML